jgi:predicted MPP superfamily phosphohydrolase
MSSYCPLVTVSPGQLALFAGAWAGHLILMIRSHNWWYGLPLSKRHGDVAHSAHAALVLAFPVVVARVWGLDLTGLFDLTEAHEPGHLGQLVLAGYVTLCLAALLIFLPAETVRRWLRRPPHVREAESRSRVIDVDKEVGGAAPGEGRERWLTRLPGNQALQVELAERALCPPRLPPEWDGLTILHLSDLHLRATPGRDYFRFVMDRCAEWDPDLVAVTGDIADSIHHQRWIVPVLGRLRWRVAALAILGNHDYWYDPPFIRRRLGRLGMHYLGNGWRQLEVRGKPLVVIGHEGPWEGPAPDLGECPPPSLEGGPFRLCLSHTPDNIAWARQAGVDLMLSGHVHGGQIRIPPFGSVLVPSRYGRRYDCGVFAEPPTLLHVSRGLGGGHPLRYFCRPEVTLLRLRSGG